MADWGLKISKPGFDVKTAQPKDLIFSSEIPCLKIVNSGRQNFTADAGQMLNYTIPHNAGSPPFLVFVFLYYPPSQVYKFANPPNAGTILNDYLHLWYEYDLTNIYVQVANFTGAKQSSHFLWFVGKT